MDTSQLKTVLIVNETGNFTRAAQRLYVAQSTVTNRIAELERELGVLLFVRGQRTVQLTKEGTLFLETANRILELEELSKQQMAGMLRHGKFARIGSTDTIYESYLEEELIAKKQSGEEFHIVLGHSEELITKLLDGILDIVYTYLPLYRQGIHCNVYKKEKLVLVTAAKNTTYETGITKDELTKVDYYMCNFRLQGIGEFLTELFPPYQQFSFEIDNSTKMVPYLLDGTGYSFLPEHVVMDAVSKGWLRVIPLLDREVPEIISYRITKEET